MRTGVRHGMVTVDSGAAMKRQLDFTPCCDIETAIELVNMAETATKDIINILYVDAWLPQQMQKYQQQLEKIQDIKIVIGIAGGQKEEIEP
jgi:hypothetical protein